MPRPGGAPRVLQRDGQAVDQERGLWHFPLLRAMCQRVVEREHGS